MTPTILVTGKDAATREAAIAALIAAAPDPGSPSAVILEGLPPPASSPRLLPQSHAGQPHLQVMRIAPGCPCCSGNLTMQVTLNRILRHAPARLYIGLASSSHLEQIRQFLGKAPYNQYIRLSEVVRL
jgi:hypothetical protein